jgi:hypothetical protein
MNSRSWRRTPVSIASVVVAGFVAYGGSVSAQAPRPSTSQVVVIGCITQTSGANPRMVITDVRGGPMPSFQLDPNDAKLTLHVGHTVEVSGTLVAGSDGDAGAKGGSLKLNVDSVKWVSSSCWMPPKK